MTKSDRQALFFTLILTVVINCFAAFVAEAVTLRDFIILTALSSSLACGVVMWFFPVVFPRRFANLVFVLDQDGNIALIHHPTYRKLNPPGSRLRLFEPPHDAIGRVMRSELGLDDQPGVWWIDEAIHPKVDALQIRVAPRPYQVQIEPNRHRWGVKEHVDFIYVCRVNGSRPSLPATRYSPCWVSYVEFLSVPPSEKFADVTSTYRRLLDELGFP